MKPLDRLLRRWRVHKAGPYISPGDRVLDVGCADGALFRRYGDRISQGIGIDPDPQPGEGQGGWRVIRGHFPGDLPTLERVDVITMLAVLEHVPPPEQQAVAKRCAELLRPGGHVVLTVPSPAVDTILPWLQRLRLIAGMALEQHHRFDPRRTEGLFAAYGFRLTAAKRFQLGLNNLFVFRKGSSP